MVFEELEAKLRLDKSSFSQNLDDAESDMEGLADRAAGIGGGLQSAGKKMTMGVTAPLLGMAGLSMKTASDVEEMESKMDAVFGDAADDVHGWADETGDAFGRSRNQMAEMATGFQDTFVPLGFAREEATGMSKEMAELASDLGSFNNMADEDAARKLQSAMVGNHSAVRDFGAILTQERLGEQVQEQFGKGIDAASEQEKAMARMELIMEDTADAQGDAARTSDSFANKLRGAKGQANEMRAEIGKHLLPVATRLVDHLSGLVGWFGSLSDRQQKVAIVIGAIAAAAGPLLVAFGTFLTMLPMLASGWATLASIQFSSAIPAALATAAAYAPLILTIGAIAAAIGLLYYAWSNNLGGIRDITKAVVAKVRGFIGKFLGWLRPIWEKHFAAIAKEVKLTAAAWKDAIMGFVEWVKPFVKGFLEFFTDLWEEHGDAIMAIVRPLFKGIKRLVETVLANVRDVIVGFIRLARGDWEGAKDAFLNIGQRLVDGVLDLFKWLKKKLIGGSVIPSMLDDIISAVTDFDLKGAFGDAVTAGLDKVTGMVSKFKSAGKNLVGAIADGIAEKASSAADSVEDMASDVRDKLPWSDAKEGPLSDLTESGEKLPETFAKGMERRADRVAGASNQLAGAAKPPAAGVGHAGDAGDGRDAEIVRVLRDMRGDVQALADELNVEVNVEDGARHDPF